MLKKRISIARFRAAEHDHAAMDALIDEDLKLIEQIRQKSLQTVQAFARAVAAQPKDRCDYKKRLAADIRREHAPLTDELRRSSIHKPSTQAWEKLAERYGHASGYALRRWVQHNS